MHSPEDPDESSPTEESPAPTHKREGNPDLPPSNEAQIGSEGSEDLDSQAESRREGNRPMTRLEKKQAQAQTDMDAYFAEMLRPPSPAENLSPHRPYEGRGPADTLKSLLDGDPLEIWDRCEEYLEEEHYIIDVERLAMRATARTAFALHSYDDREDFELFMVALIRKSARELLDEDLYGRPRHAIKDRSPNPLTVFTKNDEQRAYELRNRLNAAPRLQRAAFILVDLDVTPIPEAAKALAISEEHLFEALVKARELL